MLTIYIAAAFFVLAIIFLALSRGRHLPLSVSWTSIDSAKYNVLDRLLNESDFDYLHNQPGISKSKIRSFRRARRAVFRIYLNELAADFRVLHRTAAYLLANQSNIDQQFAVSLIRVRTQFEYRLAVIQLGLFASQLGIAPPSFAPALGAFREMHDRTLHLAH